jgi:uncharacterized protein (DUF58 family)
MSGPVRVARARLRRWRRNAVRRLRPPRRLGLLRPGAFLIAGIFGLGLAALNTGNNLLYLLLGALLGMVVLSGWMSEQVVRHAVVTRRVPRGARAGGVARIAYLVENRGRSPIYALEIREAGRDGVAFVPTLEPGARCVAHARHRFHQRGVFPLRRLVVSTSFPFGLFLKQRDVEQAGSIVVWPRGDMAVRDPRPGAGGLRQQRSVAAAATRARGDFRALRPYRPGDDPRDVNWRASARSAVPVVREYEQDAAAAFWLCLDLQRPLGEHAASEQAIELAASLAVRAARNGERFGFASADVRLDPAPGRRQLERVLDALAAARPRPDAPPPPRPAPAGLCLLITPSRREGAWGATYSAAERGS